MLKKIRKYYSDLSLPLKVTVWFFFCSFINKGLSFLTTPIFTRILTDNDYGIVSVYSSWTQIIVIFVTLGLSNSVINVGLVKYEDDKNRFQSSMLGLLFACFSITAAFILLTYHQTYRFLKLDIDLLVFLLTDCITSTVITIWLMRKRFEYDYKRMSYVTILNAVIGTTFSLVLTVVSDDRVRGRIFGCTIVALIISIYCTIDILKQNRSLYYKQYWKFALKYNIPMIPHFVSGVILNQLDRIMIENMCGANYAAIYSVAYNSAMAIFILNQAMGAVYNPWILQRLKRKEYTGIDSIVNTILFMYLMIIWRHIF